MSPGTALLRPGKTKAIERLWGFSDSDLAAVQVADQLIPAAHVLPLTVFGGARVYPIVVWDHDALRTRTWQLRGPITEPGEVRGCHAAFPTVLNIVGFVGIGPQRSMRRELAGLRSVARTIGMLPREPSISDLGIEEFDAQGSALVVVDGGEVQVLVGGDRGIREGTDLAQIWRRVFEERFFWWALQRDVLPEL